MTAERSRVQRPRPTRSSAGSRPGSALARQSSSPKPSASKTQRSRRAAAGPKLTVHPRRLISIRATVICLSIAFFAVLLAAVTIQGQRIEGQHRLDDLSREMSRETERNVDLRAEVAELESPERIMSEARDMGMIDPGPVAPLASDQGAQTAKVVTQSGPAE